MKTLLIITKLLLLSFTVTAQTSKEIQGTWRMVSTVITLPDGVNKMDSSTHNLTKIITSGRVTFTVYDKKTGNLVVTGQGTASTKGNQYVEALEQCNNKHMLKKPLVFTYKVEGNKLSYEGGNKDGHITETLIRIE